MSFFDELTQKAKVVAATASEKARPGGGDFNLHQADLAANEGGDALPGLIVDPQHGFPDGDHGPGVDRKMSFFDELTQKAKVVAATASEKAREAADSAKISASIIAEKRELDKNYRAIDVP